MSEKLFSIYRSSAGSGKTRTLAKEYLALALRFRSDYYKHILAVTFTNKATQEMKDRILHYLDAFAHGKTDSLASELMQELRLSAPEFKERASDLRANILHNYSQFSISTIDAFFQKVIRAFTREAGLSGDYRLEVENEEVMAEVVDQLVDELGSNPQLTEWIIEFAKNNLESERAWDVRSSIIDFSNEIFREEFRAIESELMHQTAVPGYFKKLQQHLHREVTVYLQNVRKQAKYIIDQIQSNGWTEEDFKYSGGVYNLLFKFLDAGRVKDLEDKEVGKRARTIFMEAANWPNAKSHNKTALLKLVESDLLEKFSALIDYHDQHYTRALSAELVLNNFYAFGLTADLARKLRDYKEENNMMLLADAPKFLNGIIRESDTPFIYEKVGSFYKNYLIDEFQDTSGLQWENFKPLLINSLDQGYPGIVVGDVKQSIYRWRGGDLQLLQHEVERHVGAHRVTTKQLASNFRSATTIVNFNNAFFESASLRVKQELNATLAEETYRDVAQQSSKAEAGIVKIQFVETADKETKWKHEVLAALPKELEQLQDKNIPLSDVAILVRNNREGAEIAQYLLDYKTQNTESRHRYDVISSESLLLEGAITVNIVVSALQILVNPEDAIARAQLTYDYGRLVRPDQELHQAFAVSKYDDFKKQMPAAFMRNLKALQKLPLFEVTETLIEVFELGKEKGEMPYLQTFQNLVLEFYTRERNDIAAFLDWWQDNKRKKSVQVSGQVDAVQILTIHKSKGLQFPYVIIPFCSWELDHKGYLSPVLWTKTEAAPFTENTLVPVKYSKLLEESIFTDAHAEERIRVSLDNLNLLYVAFTRAEHGLIVYAPLTKKNEGNTVAALLHHTLTSSSSLSPQWNAQEKNWCQGEVIKPVHAALPDNALSLHGYAVHAWRNRMVLRKKTDNIFVAATAAENTNRTRGLLIHAILARVQHASHLHEAIEKAVADGLLAKHEQESVTNQLQSLLTHDKIASWFTPDWEVKTELPVLVPNQPDIRIDRLMIKEDRVVVVDYKSGEPRPSDEEQVAAYLNILREMNFVFVEGYLLYLATGIVVPVTDKPAVKTKSKNQNQLGLGI